MLVTSEIAKCLQLNYKPYMKGKESLGVSVADVFETALLYMEKPKASRSLRLVKHMS